MQNELHTLGIKLNLINGEQWFLTGCWIDENEVEFMNTRHRLAER